MKKVSLVLAAVCVFAILFLAACNGPAQNPRERYFRGVEKMLSAQSGQQVTVDRETGCQYFYVPGRGQTPRLNFDGSPMCVHLYAPGEDGA